MTTKEFAEKVGVRPQQIINLKTGYSVKRGEGRYYYKPIFIEGRDYVWKGGNLKWLPDALATYKSYKDATKLTR